MNFFHRKEKNLVKCNWCKKKVVGKRFDNNEESISVKRSYWEKMKKVETETT